MPRTIPSDARSVRFGIREVADYRTDKGHRGFKLNGRKVLIRGGGWADDLLLDVKPRKLAAEVLYARQMNLNALRLEGFWGTSSALYDLCDRLGILVMVGWSCHWEWENYLGRPADEPYGGITTPELIDLVAESWEHQLLWLRNHPSIFVWAQASDMVPHPDLERRYIEIQKRVDPTRPTLVSTKDKTSEVTGPSGVKMRGPVRLRPAGLLVRRQRERRRLRLQHRDRPRTSGPAAREPAADDPRGQALADQRRLGLPLLPRPVQDPRPLQRGHGQAPGPGHGPRGLPPQGPVPELRGHAGHVRGLRRQQARGHGRHPVDVQLRLAEALVAALRLLPPAERGLLRRPQGRRARPPDLQLRQPRDRRGQQHLDALAQAQGHRPPPRLGAPGRRRQDGRLRAPGRRGQDDRRPPAARRPVPGLLPRPAHLQGEEPARRRQLLLPVGQARDAGPGQRDLVRDARQGLRRPHGAAMR